MALSIANIDQIARLARLGLAEDERARLHEELNRFFDIVEAMRAVDTEGVVPMAHPADTMGAVALRLRADEVSEGNERQANQRSAPAVDEGLFLVPRVIE